MGLADDLKEAPKGRPYKKLAVTVILERLDDEDREALLQALHDPEVKAPRIANALRANGYLLDLGDPNQAVRTWRARNT